MIVTHYKLVNTKAKWLGIDFFDVVALVVVFATINLFTSSVLGNFLVCACLYVGIRLLKTRKPNGWFLNSIRYYVRSPYIRVPRKRGFQP